VGGVGGGGWMSVGCGVGVAGGGGVSAAVDGSVIVKWIAGIFS